MRRIIILILPILVAVVPTASVAQRYAAPAGRHASSDTTVAFEGGDVLQVSSYPRMASGIEVCGTVGQGIHWGKMLYARTDAERNSAQESVVTFPSVGVTAACQTHREVEGQWLVVSFSRAIRDEVGRISRVAVGQIVLPLAPLRGRRVTFRWLREGVFDVGSVTPAPDTLGPPRP